MIATRTHRKFCRADEPYVAELLLTRAELDRLIRHGSVGALGYSDHKRLEAVAAEIDAHEEAWRANGTPKDEGTTGGRYGANTCPVCNGHGRDPASDNMNWLPCSSCGGTGRKPHLRVIFAGMAHPPTVRPAEGLVGGECR